VRTKSQLDWLNLPHLPILPPPVTAKTETETLGKLKNIHKLNYGCM